MGKNICQWYNWHEINIQNIPKTHIEKTTNQIKKWAENLNRHFFPPKDNIQMNSYHMKRYSTRKSKQQSIQFSSVAQLCPTLCDPMNHSTPSLPVHHQLPEFTQTHLHQVGDAIQPSHLSSTSPLAPNPSQHQSLFQWVNSSHDVAKVLEFQL